MRMVFSHWLLSGLVLTWALSHATVFGQPSAVDPKLAGKTSAADKLRQSLDKTLTVDYNAQSLMEALNHIRDKSGIKINLDQMIGMQMGMQIGGLGGIGVLPGGPNPGDDNLGPVHIKATNEKVSQILRRILRPYRLAYVISDDSLLVTSEDMAVARQMKQTVNVDLVDVPLKKAVRELARNHGINLVIDPKVANQADTAVTLKLDDSSIETTIRLLSELADLKAVRMGNVIFVTNEERAKKIRDEEKHQFDNPLNPKGPGMNAFPMVGGFGFGGGIGGGFGGIAVPARAVAPLPPPVQAVPPPPGGNIPPAPLAPQPQQAPQRPGAATPPVQQGLNVQQAAPLPTLPPLAK